MTEHVHEMNNIHEVTLTKIKVGMAKVIDERLLLDAQFNIARLLSDQFRAELVGYLLGEDIQRKEVSYPADWWQAFKDRWFPTWARRRWPVRKITTVLDAKLLYTEFKPSLQEQPYRIDVSMWSY